MRLTVVGSAGSVAGPQSSASCYLLETHADGRTWRLIIDLGAGAIGPLQRWCDPARVDAIVISHGHPDHCADLAALSVLCRYGPTAELSLMPIPLYGPPGLDRRILEVAGAVGDATAKDLDAFEIHEVVGGNRVVIGPFAFDFADAWHPVPALAMKVTGPAEPREPAGEGFVERFVEGNDAADDARPPVTLMFTGDTDSCRTVTQLAQGVGTLVAEAGWGHRPDNPPGIHMTGTQAGALAREAGAGALVVTHIASWVDPAATLAQAQEAYGAPVTLATPGMVVVL